MKQLGELDASNVMNEILSAEDLRNVTATEEELAERAQIGFMESLMSSMVQVARTNGSYVYESFIPEKPNEKQQVTLDAVTGRLKELGYNISVVPSYMMDKDKKIPAQKLIVDWSEQGNTDVSNGPENQ